MIVGYDYPILGFFWSMLIVFLWVAWIMLLFHIIVDIFRNQKMGGWGKALWLIFVVIVPFLGVLVYLLVHGGDMTERAYRTEMQHQQAVNEYIRETAGSSSTADELSKLAALKNDGVITEAEFAAQKSKLLG